MPKLFWRFFLTLWLSIVAFTILIAVLSDQVARNSGIEDISKILQQRLPPLIQSLEVSLKTEGPRVARARLQQVTSPIRNLITISNENHRELLGRKQLLRQHHRLMTAERQGSNPKGKLIKVTDPEGVLWTIRVFPAPPPRLLFSASRGGTLARLFLAALLSAIVSWILARSLARPLVQLRQTSLALAVGRLDSRVEGKILNRGDEVGDLARSFNRMATEIETQDRSRQRLLRDVAHELRSPLARMQVALELARGDRLVAQPELDLISREISRLEKLISEVLGLLRDTGSVSAMELERFSLNELLKSIVESVNFEAEARGLGNIRFHPHANPELMLSPELIYRAMENLLRNASRFTDAQRGVDLSLEVVAGGKECKLTIRDYGPGVSAEFLPQLFEPFSRDSAARERSSSDTSWGLGTAIAATAIQRHGGSIKAENAPEGGLEITVVLPLSEI